MRLTVYSVIGMLSVIAFIVVLDSIPVYGDGEFILYLDVITIFFFMPAFSFLIIITLPALCSLFIRSMKWLILICSLEIGLGIYIGTKMLYFSSSLGIGLAWLVGIVPSVVIGAVLIHLLMSERYLKNQNIFMHK